VLDAVSASSLLMSGGRLLSTTRVKAADSD
jgi:hypothetical protein